MQTWQCVQLNKMEIKCKKKSKRGDSLRDKDRRKGNERQIDTGRKKDGKIEGKRERKAQNRRETVRSREVDG